MCDYMYIIMNKLIITENQLNNIVKNVIFEQEESLSSLKKAAYKLYFITNSILEFINKNNLIVRDVNYDFVDDDIVSNREDSFNRKILNAGYASFLRGEIVKIKETIDLIMDNLRPDYRLVSFIDSFQKQVLKDLELYLKKIDELSIDAENLYDGYDDRLDDLLGYIMGKQYELSHNLSNYCDYLLEIIES